VVLLTFAIGILNICLGYALAVCLGYGPPSILEGWDILLGATLPDPGDAVAMGDK
jgi:hypothetical protein